MRDNKDLKAGFENCGNAVICVFPGQYYSDLPSHGDTVFHYNLGIDVVDVETFTCPPDIGCSECSDVKECPHANPYWTEEPTCNECGSYLERDGSCTACDLENDSCKTCDTACPGCVDVDKDCDVCPDNHCNQCTDGDKHQDHVRHPKDCMSCKHYDKNLSEDPCHDCFDYDVWVDKVAVSTQDAGPPTLPNAGDDQEFIKIGHDTQHLECLKLGLENTWADLAERCTYRALHDCALNHGASCLFDKCKRI